MAWPVDRHPPLDTLATGQSHRDVVKGVLRPDGRRVWISVSTALVELPATYGGRGVVGSFIDVTADGRGAPRAGDKASSASAT